MSRMSSAVNGHIPVTRTSNRPSLFRHTLDKLGSDIVRGKFAPSGNLPREHDLCEYLGASRSVVREATRVLAEKGMLRATPKIGIRVRPEVDWNVMDIDVLKWIWCHGERSKYVKDFLEFRLIFEPLASFHAAMSASDDERKQILTLCDRLLESNEILIAGGNRVYSISCDIAFHAAIYRASGNHMLTYLGGTIVELMARQIEETTSVPGTFALGLPLHQSVANAIAAGDATSAHHYSQMLVRAPYEDYLASHMPAQPRLGVFALQASDIPLLSAVK